MSGTYRPGYPGNAGTPLSSASQANQPVSFKTDINRKKTKKWVAAKSYSYDGDDWGDDDEDEEEEEVEEVPAVPNTSRFAAAAAQQPAPNPVAPANPPVESSSTQAPGFVRPADIYKRMQEQKQRDGASQEPARLNMVPAQGAGESSAQTPVTHQDASHDAGNTARSPSPLVIPEVKRLSGFGQDFFAKDTQPEHTAHSTHGPGIQEGVQGSSLHHNPSLGFTSVVHQAFDANETPNSSTGSFSRSNSDGTSVISPIISPWKSETDKTPTITEESNTDAPAYEPAANLKLGHRRDLSVPSPGNGPDRVPTLAKVEEGHSADVVRSSSQESFTSPEWDESEPPVAREHIESGEATPRPLSAVQQSFNQMNLEPTSTSNIQHPHEENHPHLPSPLQIPDEQPQHIPQIAPPLSVNESPLTEGSPQDMESDRLRKEIMRSFSSENMPGVASAAQSQEPEHEEPRSRPQHESTYLPSEYDSYWGEQAIPPTSPLQVRSATSPSEPATLVVNPQSAGNVPSTESVPSSAKSESRQKLKKRFSWEASDDSEEDVLEEPTVSAAPTQPIQPPPVPVVDHVAETTHADPLPLPSESSALTNPDAFGTPNIEPSLPEYSAAEKEFPEEFETQPEEPQSNIEYVVPIPERNTSPFNDTESSFNPPQTQPVPPPVNEASLPTFRKIMEISSPSEKIQVFNDTREQFAHIDSGLSNWIRRSSESLPEHADLIQANGRLPGGAPTSGLPPRAKFPKLSSLGNLSLPSSHGTDGSSSGFAPSHNRRGSGSPMTGGINRSNVESKGKDFLHSAGALGGKAGGKAAGAARGLFAKGKSKFRGADKGMSSIFRAQRRASWATTTTGSDARPSELELEPPQKPVNLSGSSRYSLQPVPRIPSLRLGDSKSFKDSFDGEGVFSMHERSFSADFSGRMSSLTEGEMMWFIPQKATSENRTMMSSDSHADESSRAGDSSIAQHSLSIETDSHDAKNMEDSDHALVATGNHGSNNTTPDQKPDESLFHAATDDVDKHEFHPADHFNHFSHMNNTSQAGTMFLLAVSPEVSPTLKHDPSQSSSLVSRLSGNDDQGTGLPIVKSAKEQRESNAMTSNGDVPSIAVSPVLQNEKFKIPAPADRRDSIISQISEMDHDEMDHIREKFDEEGVYAGMGESSPTRSEVSDLTEDDDDEVDNAIREKLDEAGFHLDPEKNQHRNRPQLPTASATRQPMRVVKMSRFSIDKKTAHSTEEDTKRYSRFSFEGEGRTLERAAEEMLVNGHGRRSGHNNQSIQDARLEGSQVPVTLGEDAPDEAPPPFSDSEAPFGEDHKEQQPQGQTLAFDKRIPNIQNRRSLQAEDPRSPPEYRPLQSPTLSIHDGQWRSGRLQDLQTHRDSIASSSVSALSNPTNNLNSARMTVSPEPPLTGSQSQQRLSYNAEANPQRNSLRIDIATPSERTGRSLWATYGRRQHSSNGSELSPSLPSGRSFGRHDGDSLHSGDSLAAQAAASRQDLRKTPSPLMNSSETNSNHSSHARASTQLLSKVKLIGKRTKGATVPANVPPLAEAKAIEKKKEKKAGGKKGALSRFGGIFNRSGPSQRPESTGQPARDSDGRGNVWGNAPGPSYPPTSHQQDYTMTTAWHSHASTTSQDKALPPPPVGYYAPQTKPIYEPPVDYGKPNYAQHQANHAGQPAPAAAQHAPTNLQYAYQSSATFPDQQLQPVSQTQPVQYAPSNDHYAYQASPPLNSQAQPEHYAPNQEQLVHPQSQLQLQHPRPQHHISTSSHSYNKVSPSLTSSNSRASNNSPELEQSRSRARELRMRSRSPRPTQVHTVASRSENVNYADPAYNLGKFNVVTETPRIGDQSLPFPIMLPDDLANGQLSPRSSIQPESRIFYNNRNRLSAGEQTQNPGLGLNTETQVSIASAIAEPEAGAGASETSAATAPTTTVTSPTTPGISPQRSNINSEMYETRPVISKNTIPVELPVPNEHDEEEIVMSSNASPGQEWRPAGFESWMPYY